MFEAKNHKSYIIIVGCGEMGAYLAGGLSADGCRVAIIDSTQKSFERLPDSFSGLVLERDANDAGALEEADAKVADAVIAVTNCDVLNMFVCKVAKEIYQVSHVLACPHDQRSERCYEELGVKTICASELWLEAFRMEMTR